MLRRNMLVGGLLFASTSALSAGSASSDSSARFLDERLDNKMRVILEKNDQSPAVMHMVVYNVGGLSDYHGRAGLAHFFEHLMFRSTKRFKAGDSTKFLDEIGAKHNASTHFEFTNYYQMAHKDYLCQLMDYESDRMKNLLLTDDEVEKERSVIKEERNLREESSIENRFFEQLLAAHYGVEYYGRPIIGSMADISSIKKVDLLDFYGRFYNPENATLIVVGDIEFDKTMDMVKHYYGQIKSTEHNSAFETPKLGGGSGVSSSNKSFVMESPEVHGAPDVYYLASAPTLVEGLTEQEAATFYVLDQLISKYLQDYLVDELDIASSAEAGAHQFAQPNSFYIIAVSAKEGKDQDANAKTIGDLINGLIYQGKLRERFNDEDIIRAENQAKADFIYMMDRIEGRANVFAQLVSIGQGPELLEKFPDMISKVKKQDIEQLFERIFVKKNHTMGMLKAPPEELSEETLAQTV